MANYAKIVSGKVVTIIVAEAEFFNDNEIKNHGSYTDYQRSPSLIL